MAIEEENAEDKAEKTEIIAKGPNIGEISEALGIQRDDGIESEILDSEKVAPIVETFDQVYEGVVMATENDERGRARKKVQEYAGCEEMDADLFGTHLRLLEAHGIVERDGNRWRIPDTEL